MKTGIIIVNWNGLADTQECVRSVLATPGEKHVVIVDNNSKNDEAGVLQQIFPTATIIASQENSGFSEANNRGIAEALRQGCEGILILNNDAVVTPGFLLPLQTAVASNDQIGISTPKILFYQSSTVWAAGGALNLLFARGTNRGEGKQDAEVRYPSNADFASGCCFYMTRHIAERFRFFPSYFLYYEDVDFSIAVRKAGYSIHYVPESVVYHKASRSSGALLSYQRIYYLSRNKLLLVSRQYTTTQKILFWCLYPIQVLATIGYIAVATKSVKRTLNLWRAWWSGVRDYRKQAFGLIPK